MSDYFERVERQIVQRIEGGVPRSSRLPTASGYLAVAAAAVVVIVVVGIFLLARGGSGGNPSPATSPAIRLTFAESSPRTAAALERTVQVLQRRLDSVIPGAEVHRAGERILVQAPSAAAGARAEILALAAPGQLAFYDWEGAVLAQNGRTVADQLRAQDPAALSISQGNGTAPPGDPGAGSMSLRQALALAARIAPGARYRTEDVGGLAIRVPIGYAVLQATRGTQFYVVRGNPPMSNGAIVDPQQKIDPNTHSPNVEFKFTVGGRREFEALTATIARRGSLVSGLGQTLNQHFAIAVDNKLASVPYIDFMQYPDGITGERGAAISGSLTRQSAKILATLLRYGPLPVTLTATG